MYDKIVGYAVGKRSAGHSVYHVVKYSAVLIKVVLRRSAADRLLLHIYHLGTLNSERINFVKILYIQLLGKPPLRKSYCIKIQINYFMQKGECRRKRC